jgi:hypothetical protein
MHGYLVHANTIRRKKMQRKYNGVTLLYFAVSKGNKKEPIGRGEWNGNYVIFYCKTKHEREMHRK